MRVGSVALVVRYDENQPILVDSLSDEEEIRKLERSLDSGEPDPLSKIYEARKQQLTEDEEFGDYVEELLSQPFVRPEVKKHGVQWLKSKIRIEKYQKCERSAVTTIAEYAYRVFLKNTQRDDFFLAGPKAQVRIRVYVVEQEPQAEDPWNLRASEEAQAS